MVFCWNYYVTHSALALRFLVTTPKDACTLNGMALPKKLVVAIHDLHPWGGQDKSNLEILYHVNQSVPIELHAFSFIDQRTWPAAQHMAYTAPAARPAFFKLFYYTVASFFRLRRYGSRKRRQRNGVLIQTTGTASAVADLVQVQFIHKTWNGILKDYDISESSNFLKNLYHSLLGAYNVLNEDLVFTARKKYVAISHSIKKELIEHFAIPPDNIQTIYHGVNADYFFPAAQDAKALDTRAAIRAELGLPDGAVALLHVGAINQRKGIFNSVRMLGFLKKQGVGNVFLVAVGDGDKKELQALAAREGVASEVKIVSHSKNVRDYYWASDVFFFPSIYEPFGLVILEAMACGLPCAISGHAGATELIENGENGIVLQNILDPETMAHELHPLLKDEQRRTNLGRQARLTAEKRRWELVAEEYLDFYQKILS